MSPVFFFICYSREEGVQRTVYHRRIRRLKRAPTACLMHRRHTPMKSSIVHADTVIHAWLEPPG